MDFTDDLKRGFYNISKDYPTYGEVLSQAMFALLTQEHVLWLSKPGRAKSEVALRIFGMFEGAPTFKRQLTKQMMVEELVGNLITDELMKTGREIYNFANMMVEAVFAYLDEFSDGSDFVLRALNSILNERIFMSPHQGVDGIVQTPTHTAICTTNYLRENQATQAVLDRVMCKAWLAGVVELTDCMSAGRTYLNHVGKSHPVRLLPYEELLKLSEHIQSPDGILVSPGMQALHMLLIQEFKRRRDKAEQERFAKANPDLTDSKPEDEDISPRTMVKLYDFCRAAAALEYRDQVEQGDLRSLGFGLYVVGDPDDYGALWHELCDEFLNMPHNVLESLEDLGAIAEAVCTIKSEMPDTTPVQLKIGGKFVNATHLDIRNVIDRITGNSHPVTDLVKQQLKATIDSIGTGQERSYNVLNGWS